MKRHELMSKDAIMAFIRNCATRTRCYDCPANHIKADLAEGCLLTYLEQEIKMIPRWQTAHTQEDFNKLHDSFVQVCYGQLGEDGHCGGGCPYIESSFGDECYHRWLSEMVETSEAVE